MRILVDVSEQQVSALNSLAKRTGKARAEIIREALDKHVQANHQPLSAFYGIWADNPDTQDIQGYLDRIRGEWDLEWDR